MTRTSLSFYIRHLQNGFPRLMTTIMTDNRYLLYSVTILWSLPPLYIQVLIARINFTSFLLLYLVFFLVYLTGPLF